MQVITQGILQVRRNFKNMLIFGMAILVVSCVETRDTKPLISKSLIIQPGPEISKDVQISLYEPNKIYKDEEYLMAFSWTILNNPVINRSFISFDITELKDIVELDSAFVTLTIIPGSGSNMEMITPSGNNEIKVQRILESWIADSTTWFNAPQLSDDNVIIVSTKDTSHLHTGLKLNVKKMFGDNLKSENNEFGISYKLTNEEPYSVIMFASSEHDSIAYRPKLEVFYKE